MADTIDREVQPLVDAISAVPYLATVSCCAGHPDEKTPGFQYAVANVVFEVKDEPRNLFRWYRLMERVLRFRRDTRVRHDWGCTFDRRFSLGEDDVLSWEWVLKIEGSGRDLAGCRAALDEGIAALVEPFQAEAEECRAR